MSTNSEKTNPNNEKQSNQTLHMISIDEDPHARDIDSLVRDKDSLVRDKDSNTRDKDSYTREKDSHLKDKDSFPSNIDPLVPNRHIDVRKKDFDFPDTDSHVQGAKIRDTGLPNSSQHDLQTLVSSSLQTVCNTKERNLKLLDSARGSPDKTDYSREPVNELLHENSMQPAELSKDMELNTRDKKTDATREYNNGLNPDNQNSDRGISSDSSADDDLEIIEKKKKIRRRILLILVIVNITSFIASFSYWIQSGVLPYLTRKIGVTPELFGYMQSTFALYQLLGSPIFGRCGDVFGCRIIMVVSEIASAVTYGALAFSSSIWMLFLARVPAFFMHNLQGSYMIITDVTLPTERADLIGKLGVSHGLGMIAGSFVGGVVTDVFSEESAALVAACGNIISMFIILAFIPDDTKLIRRTLDDLYKKDIPSDQASPGLSFGITELLNVLKMRIIRYLLLIKIISGFPFSLLYSMFTITIMDHFKLGPKENGLILAYIGLLGILTQGLLIGLLTRRYSFPTLIKCAIFLNTCTFMFMIVTENIIFLCVLILPLAVGGTLLHIILTTAVTKVVPIEDTGSALGLSSAVSALVRSVAPSVGGLVFTNLGWPFFGVIGYAMFLSLSCFISFYVNEDY